MIPAQIDMDSAVQRAHELLSRAVQDRRRRLLAVAGSPGSGKSTLTQAIVATLQDSFPGATALVGMDGFHLAGQVLARRGLAAIKGAPETFDAAGYVALLERLVVDTDSTVYAPVFHRDIEESIAHEAEIGPQVRLVVTEGNYLLLPEQPWSRIAELATQSWFVELDDSVRLARLRARHEHFGLSAEAAMAKAMGPDEDNARLVARSANRADARVRIA